MVLITPLSPERLPSCSRHVPQRPASPLTCRSLKDLPEGILADDLALGELQQVHPPHLDVLSRHRCARERPFRDAEIL